MAETKNPKVRLQYDKILTTMNEEKVTKSGLIRSSSLILNRQTVVACGPNSGVKVGDEVEINPAFFPKRFKEEAKNDVGPDIYTAEPPIEYIDGIPYLYISSREIKWIYEK